MPHDPASTSHISNTPPSSRRRNPSATLYSHLPETPGVYLMRAADNTLLYVGKAGNLRRRVSSYFTKAHDSRLERLVAHIHHIDHETTDTALEALIREAKLIKLYTPPYNIREKDDKSFLYVEISKDKFPRVPLVRGKDIKEGRMTPRAQFGPFTSASSIREGLKIIRRIFPFSTHPPEQIGTCPRPCFEAEIGLCPGTCTGAITLVEYRKTIRNLKLFFEDKKARLIRLLTKEMETAAKKLDYERAETLRRKVFALQHIRDIALINEPGPFTEDTSRGFRIEGYDISNISGTSAVGSMVVFINGMPAKQEYRKFKIRSVEGSDDTGMMREVLERRLKNDWPLPDLILVDGGMGQVHTAKKVLAAAGKHIPIIGLAKGPERKRNDLIGTPPVEAPLEILVRVRDEAHRFAITYHKTLRSRNLFTRG